MLQIRVENSDVRRRRRQHPLNAGRGEAAASYPFKHPNVPICLRRLSHYVGCAIRGVIIHENYFPLDACEGLRKSA